MLMEDPTDPGVPGGGPMWGGAQGRSGRGLVSVETELEECVNLEEVTMAVATRTTWWWRRAANETNEDAGW